uniref:DEUBAD domain-containing protein n=1 Tax=Rhizophora mucronata TaxID=61149 RepID=A0A2P2M560_RHIMU
MAIEKNGFKAASRFDSEFSPNSGESVSSDEEELQRRVLAVESDEEDDDDEFDDADSGAGSDDFDLLELGETGAEFCQVGNVTCTLPLELYDLPGLGDVLSVDVWNEVLTEEEKFGLTNYLPDMDQDTFIRTLKELLEGANFHFGSPVKRLFEMLKGGLCEPRVALYREGLSLFKKRKHYHFLKKHHNSMVLNFCQTRDAWLNCKGYSIEEKLRVLNIMRSQKSLMYEKMEEDLDMESPQKEEHVDGILGKRKYRKTSLKLSRDLAYGSGLDLEVPSRLPSMGLEVAKHRKQNPKGILKFARRKSSSSKEMTGRAYCVYPNLDVNSKPFGSAVPISQQNKAVTYDSGAILRLRDRMRFDDNGIDYDDNAEGSVYGMDLPRDQNVAHSTVPERTGLLKAGKKHDFMRSDEVVTDDLVGFPLALKNDFRAYGRNRTANKLSEMEVYAEKPPNISSFEIPRKAKYLENAQQFAVRDQIKSVRGRAPHLAVKDNRVDLSDNAETIWPGSNRRQVLTVDSSFNDWNVRSKKWKTGRESPDLNFKGYRASSPQVDDRILLSDLRSKVSQEKARASLIQNGRQDKGALRAKKLQIKSEETESDSSEQFDDEEEVSNPLMRSKSAYTSTIMECSGSSLLKSGTDIKKTSSRKKGMQDNTPAFDGISYLPRKAGSFVELGQMPGCPSKAKQKGKMRDSSLLYGSGNRDLEDNPSFSLGKLKDDDYGKKVHRIGRSGQLRGENGERLLLSGLKAYPSDRKQRGEVSHDDIPYEDDDLLEPGLLTDENMQSRVGKKGQGTERYGNDRHDRSEASLLGCNSVTKKRKAKEIVSDMDGRGVDGIMQSNLKQQIDGSISSKKKGKKKLEVDTGSPDKETFEQSVTHPAAPADVELETRPQKKPYTPITPTVHTGFSFSIIHLLSAVRMSMITPLSEDSIEFGKSREEQNKNPEDVTSGAISHENADVNKSDHGSQVHLPSLTVQEIVNRVRSNPGDPCILETQEPLQDLVRGVLKIFASKSAPLGAKGWKALVVYEKLTKSWSWIGPASQTSTDHETVEELTSPEYWGLPYKMLVKLVDSFANWLKSGQETLQQIGSLPPPPLSSMQCNLDEKERFRDLRAQKSLNTISPSSEEVRAYFRKEEVLRYSIPDRAFSYTAADGKKSIVAPLRRCGGKPTSKARDHFMLKRDRPPHVTILCLVRDAAARLPGSIGTRADVCTLIRDSQYIVEDVSNTQVNQIVSGALDRLHYERDPCVQFDGERKLWVYLHREREEEDFEDDGTSSTKKWKRQKKEPSEQSDQGAVTVAFHGTGDQSGFDLGSDLNADPSGTDDDNKIRDMVYEDARLNGEGDIDAGHGSEQGKMQQGHPMVWEGLGLNSAPENKLLCQENSTNDDFDDEAFEGERPDGLFSESLL